MKPDLYADLAWLPPPPADFRERCRDAVARPDGAGTRFSRLAGYALDESGLRQLAAAIEAARNAGIPLEPLVPMTLGVVGNGTLDYLVPLFVASAARHGIALECVLADYGQVAQEALVAQSRVNRARPDAVLVALDARGLPLQAGADATAASASVEAAVDFVTTLRSAFAANAGATCLVQTIAPGPETLFGSYDLRFAGTPLSLAAAFNAALIDSLRGGHDALVDVASLAQTVGLANWHSPKQWNLGKLPFDARYLPLYAEHVARVLGALRGKSRRCLILDLDNTIWGGLVGDDGVEGIALGQGDATGEAFLGVQAAALALRDRGIVLAVSSKNDDAVARAPFREHPEMLLREEHLAVFAANWNDKASNVAAIASTLNLGLDAMVFFDDNPAEREQVRATLPEVAVPELPADPALYARYLAAAGYFESVAFSEDDRIRAESYAAEAKRVEARERIGDLDAYLASLEMRIALGPFEPIARARIAQLINKTNQFNLTTRRYSDLDVAALETDPDAFTLQVRLEDRFGDYGTIGAVIARTREPGVWEIDTWLMSCRVLGRGVERMVLRELLEAARARGIERLVGIYIPSPRNALVRDHYAMLGFSPIGGEAGATHWSIETSAHVEPAPMTVVRRAPIATRAR